MHATSRHGTPSFKSYLKKIYILYLFLVGFVIFQSSKKEYDNK